MTYATEFPDFPAADLPAIPAIWSDASWHNDACPFFLITGSLGVWIDYADPAMSDLGPDRGPRFALVAMEDGQHGDSDSILATDDWDALLAHAIGLLFVAGLKAELEADDFAEMRRMNLDSGPGTCASHDFCDSNMVMDPAFRTIMGREIDPASEADAALWGAAWEGAMPALTATSEGV